MTTRALRTSPLVTAVGIAVVVIPLAACGGDESGQQRTDNVSTIVSTTEGDVGRFVESFMKERLAGRVVDEFLSTEAAAQYKEHATGLWLHDDTYPGGPGGEYRDFAVETPDPNELGRQVEVRIRVDWVGDATPEEIVELLTVGDGPEGELLVLEAERGDDPADDGLPFVVAKKRYDIFMAAVRHDYKALRSLLDPETFSYSFGEEGDPIGYWREQEEVGEVPILGDTLPVVLHTRFGLNEGTFVWPSAAAKLPSDWTEEDIEGMRDAGYTDRDIRAFEEQVGGYAGWRVGIRADGTWLYFISGD
jgi:hypothetical protein